MLLEKELIMKYRYLDFLACKIIKQWLSTLQRNLELLYDAHGFACQNSRAWNMNVPILACQCEYACVFLHQKFVHMHSCLCVCVCV